MHDQRDAGVAQGIEPRSYGKPGGRVQRGVAGGVDPELGDHIQRRAAAGQFDDLRLVSDRLERGASGRALDQAGDVPVDHRAAQPVRDGVDELLALEDASDVPVVEDPLDAGQAERRAGHHHRFANRGRRSAGRDGKGGAGLGVQTALDHVDEEAAQLGVPVGGNCGPSAPNRRGVDRAVDFGRGVRGCGGKRGEPEPGRVQPAQRLVERGDIARFRVVGEQGQHIVAEDVLDEAVQRLLGADLDEDAGTRRV